MLTFNTYHAPGTVEEAHVLLNTHKKAQVLGGGAFLRLGNRRLSHIIDLSNAGLNTIVPLENTIKLGAMTTFRELETHPALQTKLQSYFKEALGQIVGIQLRNMVTLGGTLYSRYGFSDLNTAFMALGARVHMHKSGVLSIEDFMESGSPQKDILTFAEIPNQFEWASFKSARLSTADYALINMAAVKRDGTWRLAVGARPHRAVLAVQTMRLLNENPLTPDLISRAAVKLTEEISFGSNRMASSDYRSSAAFGLAQQILMEATEHENQI